MTLIIDTFSIDDEISLSKHAREQMKEREIDYEEVVEIFERAPGGLKGRRKNTLEARAVTSHNRWITVVYTRRLTGPHVITVIDHNKKGG